jgi:pyrroloquinoline quinone (PQQ) biosynthesis protein C
MEEAQERFAVAARESLAQWAAHKATEEAGHDRLALLDIQSLGYDAEAVVKALFPPAAKTLMDYFTQSVHTTDPIGCVGYSYTMERLALGIGEKYIQAVEALLPQGTHATRCLRVHSSVGSDVEHVKEMVEMVAGLAPQECTRVAAACYETALLCFSPPKEDYISEEELEYVLKPLEYTKNHN